MIDLPEHRLIILADEESIHVFLKNEIKIVIVNQLSILTYMPHTAFRFYVLGGIIIPTRKGIDIIAKFPF